MVSSVTAKLKLKFDSLIDGVQEGALEGMDNSANGALRAGRRAIELRGTQGSKKRFAGEYLPAAGPGRSDGREDTGRMIDSLGAEVSIDNGVVTGTVGWFEDYEEYFGMQEEGFDNYKAFNGSAFVDRRGGKNFRGPIHTPGMFIFRDIETLMTRTAPGLVAISVKAKIKDIK